MRGLIERDMHYKEVISKYLNDIITALSLANEYGILDCEMICKLLSYAIRFKYNYQEKNISELTNK